MFAGLRKIFGGAEEKSLANPTAEELALFTGVAPSGYSVSTGEALRVPAVQLCIRLIAEGVANLDRRVVRIEGDREIDAPEHPATRFLTTSWNEWTSAYEGVRDLISQALTRDCGGLMWLNRPGDDLREIVPYASLTANYDPETGEPSYTLGGRPVAASEVLHVRGPFSRAPLSLARESIGLARVMERRAAKLFDRGARPGGVVTFPNKLDAEAFTRFRKSWRETHEGPDASGATAVLWDGATFKAEEFKSVDQQFSEMRKEQVIEIGRAFGVPPSMLFNHDRATWGNFEQASKAYLVDTLESWVQVTEAALTRALIPEDERAEYRVFIDRDDMTRADIGARATAYSQLISARVINPNQARKWEGLDPYEGGDEYMNPHITTTTRQTGPAAPKDDA